MSRISSNRSPLRGAVLVLALLGAGAANAAERKPSPPAEAAPSAGPAAAPAAKHYVMTVLTNAVPGREKEFNDWYTNVHLREVLAVPGFVRAQRFRVLSLAEGKPQWNYYASYELKTEDAAASVKELMRRYNAGEMASSPAMDPVNYFAVFEPITPVVSR